MPVLTKARSPTDRLSDPVTVTGDSMLSIVFDIPDTSPMTDPRPENAGTLTPSA